MAGFNNQLINKSYGSFYFLAFCHIRIEHKKIKLGKHLRLDWLLLNIYNVWHIQIIN